MHCTHFHIHVAYIDIGSLTETSNILWGHISKKKENWKMAIFEHDGKPGLFRSAGLNICNFKVPTCE